MNFLGQNIRQLRKRHSVTQSELAALINKGQTTIGNWENGVSEPNIQELLVLSNYFGVSLDHLVKSDLSREPQDTSEADAKNTYDHSPLKNSVVHENETTYLTGLHKEINALWVEVGRLRAHIEKKSPGE